MKLKLTDFDGQPFVGSTVVAIYDKSVEYISGGSNVPEIKEFFWKWRRQHNPQTESSLGRWFGNLDSAQDDRHERHRRLRRHGGRGDGMSWPNRRGTGHARSRRWRAGAAGGMGGGGGQGRWPRRGA